MDNADRITTPSTILNPSPPPNVHLSPAVLAKKTSTKASHLTIATDLDVGTRFMRMVRVEGQDFTHFTFCMFAG